MSTQNLNKDTFQNIDCGYSIGPPVGRLNEAALTCVLNLCFGRK